MPIQIYWKFSDKKILIFFLFLPVFLCKSGVYGGQNYIGMFSWCGWHWFVTFVVCNEIQCLVKFQPLVQQIVCIHAFLYRKLSFKVLVWYGLKSSCARKLFSIKNEFQSFNEQFLMCSFTHPNEASVLAMVIFHLLIHKTECIQCSFLESL